jgi:hypothetical protein
MRPRQAADMCGLNVIYILLYRHGPLWLDEKTFVDLVALSQFLPGPASSKVGIAIGLSRARYPGTLAARAGFTLPSALLLVLFGYGVAPSSRQSRVGPRAIPVGGAAEVIHAAGCP